MHTTQHIASGQCPCKSLNEIKKNLFNFLPTLYLSIEMAVKVTIDAVPVSPPTNP